MQSVAASKTVNVGSTTGHSVKMRRATGVMRRMCSRDHKRAREWVQSTSCKSSTSKSFCEHERVARAFTTEANSRANETFDGQEVIDCTAEETNGNTSVGQTGVVRSVERGGLLVIEGLRSSVRLGSTLAFPGTKATAVLLGHREPKSFAMMATKIGSVHVPDLDNVAMIKVDDFCEVARIGDDVNDVNDDEDDVDAKPPPTIKTSSPTTTTTRKTIMFQIPPEKDLRGKIVSALGAPVSIEGFKSISDEYMTKYTGEELIRDPPPVDARKPITTPLLTGATAVDVLTPIGRGQCLLVSGEPNTGLSEFLQMAIKAQSSSNVRCIYAAVGASKEKSEAIAKILKLDDDNKDNKTNTKTTMVTVSKDATVTERYVATLTAFAIAEGARKNGQDALLCIDDFSGMTGFAREMAFLAPDTRLDDESGENREEIEGMLVSAAMAERRRFLGTTLQRIARLNDKLGGGSITLLGAMTHPIGAYDKDETINASSEKASLIDFMSRARESVANFDKIPEALQNKLAAALEAKHKATEQNSSSTSTNDSITLTKRKNQTSAPENEFVQSRPLVEEFMSITDGQVFIKDFNEKTGWIWDQKMSVSRIGAPGQAQAFKKINALELRLQLMQSEDMSTFGKSGEEKRKMNAKSNAVGLFLKQTPGEVRSIAESFVGIYAMTKTSFAEREDVSSAKMLDFANACIAETKSTIPFVVDSMNANPKDALSLDDETKISIVVKQVATKMFS
jgi:F0F1-type ATP synthase alpha subunit